LKDGQQEVLAESDQLSALKFASCFQLSTFNFQPARVGGAGKPACVPLSGTTARQFSRAAGK
jgi:hypothetical protein